MIATDRTIHANRPDLILVLKKERRAYLVDLSCPFDNNVTRKEGLRNIKTYYLKYKDSGM